MKIVPIVLLSGLTHIQLPIQLPVEVEFVAFRNHLDGARAWFLDNGKEEKRDYLIKQYNVRTGINHEVLEKKHLLKKISCPKNSILLGVLFDKDSNPNFFLLEPKNESVNQTLYVALVKETEELPDGYVYHSTSLQPNFATRHCVYKVE